MEQGSANLYCRALCGGGYGPAADRDDGGGQGEEELDGRSPAFGAAPELAEVVHPGVRAFDDPPAAGLDWDLRAARGDAGVDPSVGQAVVDALVVVAGVQSEAWMLRQRPEGLFEGGEAVEGGGQQGVVTGVGRCRLGDQGYAGAVVNWERFRPSLARSTGLLPAHSPPEGALVIQPSALRRSSSRPIMRS